MDPIGTATAIISAINYLRDAVDKVKENREQCRKFYAYAKDLRDVVQNEYKNGVPKTLCPKLRRLTR